MSFLAASPFDLAKTLDSGQVFHWTCDNQGGKAIYCGVVGQELFSVCGAPGGLEILRGDPVKVGRYFALDHPLRAIAESFPRDPSLDAAADFCQGLRIIRQEPWECVATFITSALKQVPHIRQISFDLRRRFGTRLEEGFFAYPPPVALAIAGEMALRESKLGFRAKNLARAAEMIAAGGIDLAAPRELPTADLRRELCRIPGVGEKVANCVLLFAYERLEAFPIDVWIERVLRELYFSKKRNVTSERLRRFAATYFGPYAGYAQQYLFHHARLTMGRRRR